MKATDARALATAIQILAGTFNKDIVSITVCNVTSVNEDEFTCDCTAISGDADTSIPGVNLNAEANDSFTLVPKVDSTVLVASSSRNKYFVFKVAEIDKIICVIDENNKFTFSSSGFVWNDGTLGGITKTLELKSQLDKMNAQLQAVITALSTWTVVPNDGGAALKAFFATQISGKPAGNFNAIEDTKIKH